jgi:hypothetical protein
VAEPTFHRQWDNPETKEVDCRRARVTKSYCESLCRFFGSVDEDTGHAAVFCQIEPVISSI